MSPRVISAAVLLPLLVACGGEEPAPIAPIEVPPAPQPPPPASGPAARLARGVMLDLSTGSRATVTVRRGDEWKAVELAPDAGHMYLRSDEGALRSPGLVVRIPDVIVAPEVFPPHGLHLVGIEASAALQETRAVWTSTGTADLTARAALFVEWALRTKSGDLAIRPLELGSVPVRGSLTLGPGDAIGLTLRLDTEGSLFDVAGFAEIRGLSLDLELAERSATP